MENYNVVEGGKKTNSYFTSAPIKSWETRHDTVVKDRAEQMLPVDCYTGEQGKQTYLGLVVLYQVTHLW